jgi:uncharacterized membrane protein YbaN (DUF454 family)
MFQTNIVEKTKTHILCSITFFQNLVVYDIMWENIVELERQWMTIWLMRVAFWLTKRTDTHKKMQYALLFHCKNDKPKRISMLRLYIHFLCYLYKTKAFLLFSRISVMWSCHAFVKSTPQNHDIFLDDLKYLHTHV